MIASDSRQFHILVVDDDKDIREGLQDYLELKGYRVSAAADGEQALALLDDRKDVDLALLDVMMPRMNGFDLVRHLRAKGHSFPVLMLTARGETQDILNGFELGVDDYVVKPFSADVLIARVRAILTRHLPPSERPMDIHFVGNLEVNFSSHRALRGGEAVELTVQEFELLHYMIENKGRTLTREQILMDVWRLPPDLITRTIDRHIASLRKKIEPNPAFPVYIETVYGSGYRLSNAAPPEASETTPAAATAGLQ